MLTIYHLFAFLLITGAAPHDLFMSICEMERTTENQLEIRFYLFQDDLKTALYQNPQASDIDPGSATKYISEKIALYLNDEVPDLQFKTLDYRQGQVRLVFEINLSPNQKIEKIDISNLLLIEHFPAQVNMVYFIQEDGERLVKMLDASRTEASFSF